MRFFHDQEFLEDGKAIHPMSIGMVTEEGKSYYGVFRDAFSRTSVLQGIRSHPWIMANVVPHLPDLVRQRVYDQIGPAEFEGSAYGHPVIKPKWQIATEVEAFIRQHGNDRDQHELWTWYGAYDHVMLAQLWGPMIQLPSCVPMHTNDLKAFVDQHAALTGDRLTLPAQGGDVHDALADARWNFAAWRVWWQAAQGLAPRAYTVSHDDELVTVPSRVFVAGYERLTSQGPGEALGPADEVLCRKLWERLGW